MLHLPEGLDLRCSWADLGLQSHQLIQLTSRLRLVPAWTNVDIHLCLPDRPLTQVVNDLRALLQRPSTTTEKGWPAVLHCPWKPAPPHRVFPPAPSPGRNTPLSRPDGNPHVHQHSCRLP